MGLVRQFLRQLRPALVAIVTLTLVCGLLYTLLVTAVAQTAFGQTADGSLLSEHGRIVGSSLLGQRFNAADYFHPRPSAAGDGYDGQASGASNMGPANPDYLNAVAERVRAYREQNHLPAEMPVPADAVQASGSGLDPEISIANARLQAPRVASERNLALSEVLALVDENTRQRPLGILGDPGVNVLQLNLALDRAG